MDPANLRGGRMRVYPPDNEELRMIELDPTKDYDLQASERELERIQHDLAVAEEQLVEAQRALTIAQGRVYYHTYKPKRHEVLNPSTSVHGAQLYTYCMQLGYRFAMLNGKVHYAGTPSEGMVNTGINLEDVPA